VLLELVFLKEEGMKVYKIALAIALVFVIGCGGSTAFRSGKVYYEKNRDYPKAEEWLRKAVAQEPNNWEAHLYLALALAQQEKYSDAAVMFKKAREIAPEAKKEHVYNNQRSFFVNNYNKGITANSTMNYQEAVEFFKMAVAVDPDDPKGYVNLGVAYSMLDDTENALNSFRQGAEADPTSVDAWRNLGITYQATRQFALATEAFTRVVELAPDDSDGLFSLGDMFFNEREFEKALEPYMKAAEYRGDDAALQYQIGATYFSLQNYAEAGEAFQKAAALSQDKEPTLYKDAMFNLGVAYIKLEDYDAAIATLERVLEIEETVELHEMLGAAYGKKGMKDKAIEEFERAKELSGE
jgi:tetratricopeptide (TPR) repeat protein